nr:protein BIG GRAIN 1-like B [Tanacetum cinerariifolium]
SHSFFFYLSNPFLGVLNVGEPNLDSYSKLMSQMYNWDKSHKKDKPRKNGQIPSFSSTLLDEIYRFINGGEEKFGEFKVRKPKVAKKPIRGKSVEDEEIASFHRACLVEKWMEIKANEKEIVAHHMPPTLPEFGRKGVLDNDPLFFSSGSSSSDFSFE